MLTCQLPADRYNNALNFDGKKEKIAAIKLIAFDAGTLTFREIVDLRIYCGRSRNASVVHASVWVHFGCYNSGRASASGYGYDKEGAAADGALRDAGFTFYRENGTQVFSLGGIEDVRHALRAIGRAAGYADEFLHVVES